VTSEELRGRVDAALREFLDRVTPALAAVSDDLAAFTAIVEGFVLDGGKRLRPAFCYWGHRAAGGADSDALVRAAASLELVQACALVHDDVIDASDTRRGAPSVHRRFAGLHRSHGWHGDPDAFGAAGAILLGDLALVWADTMLAESGFDAAALAHAFPVWDVMRVEVMSGQYLDVVEQARGGGSVERALRVARYKSAKYTVERPLHLGAALAGAGPGVLDALSGYGLPVGEAFQLRDDVLGVFGDPEHTGKPAGDDLREGKRTVLVAYALDAADDAQRQTMRRLLGDPTLDADGVMVLRDIITATGALDRVEQLIDERHDQARRALEGSQLDAAATGALAALAEAATNRAR
jgi:geranylgeranyl diphosphate synthase type I